MLEDAAIEAEVVLVRDPQKGGWSYAPLPGSREALGTGRPVRVTGTVDEVRIDATLLPLGGGTHMLPLRAAVIRALGKGDGDRVVVRVRPRAES